MARLVSALLATAVLVCGCVKPTTDSPMEARLAQTRSALEHDGRCMSGPGAVVSWAGSLEAIEAKSLEEMRAVRLQMPSVPELPFGYANQKWEDFKHQLAPGDSVVLYRTCDQSWQELRGESGYAAVRQGRLVAVFVGLVN